jgi:hypothetical protein
MDPETRKHILRDTQPQKLQCVICGKPTMRLVDGEPSCDYHANQVYEHQLEEYIRKNMN